jgi:hypothetical protein
VTFNRGFLCNVCGPIRTATSSTKNKVKRNVCPECQSVVSEWQRPKNERVGKCGCCANGSFTLAIVKRHVLRCCDKCKEVLDTDTMQVVRKGSEDFKWREK